MTACPSCLAMGTQKVKKCVVENKGDVELEHYCVRVTLKQLSSVCSTNIHTTTP